MTYYHRTSRKDPTFQRQPDINFSQANPVNDTEYTVLDITPNVRIHSLALICQYTVQPDTIEVWVTVDDIVFKHAKWNPLDSTYYEAYNTCEYAESSQGVQNGTNAYSPFRPFMYEGQRVKVTMKRVNGTVTAIGCRCKWSKIP